MCYFMSSCPILNTFLLLSYSIFFIMPLIYLSFLLIIPNGRIKLLKIVSLIFHLFLLNCLLGIWVFFVFYKDHTIVTSDSFKSQTISICLQLNSFLVFAINPVNILFLILTTFLTVIVILISWQWLAKFYSIRIYLLLVFLIQYISFYFFTTENLLTFYIFFEAVLIPMYFLIGIWGLRHRKIHAAYQFFLYTFAGSLFMLISILYLKLTFGTLCINHLRFFSNYLNLFEYKLIWLSFFLGFAIKTPIIPFHIWLPEAHVEAPTSGSVILAGLLLKYGTYGFYKILLFLFFNGIGYFSSLTITLSLISIIYGSLITYIQVDFKKIIAYSSVSHMGYVILGLSILSPESIIGSLLMMLTHGFISSALFL